MDRAHPWHWEREPVDSTREFVNSAAFSPTEKGLQAAIEVIAYPDGHATVASSRISGAARNRSIVQSSSLPFRNIEEAMDAVDMIPPSTPRGGVDDRREP